MEKLYNHAFDIAFALETTASCEGDDYPTKNEVLDALEKRLEDLRRPGNEWEEAIGAPFDTFIVGED